MDKAKNISFLKCNFCAKRGFINNFFNINHLAIFSYCPHFLWQITDCHVAVNIKPGSGRLHDLTEGAFAGRSLSCRHRSNPRYFVPNNRSPASPSPGMI